MPIASTTAALRTGPAYALVSGPNVIYDQIRGKQTVNEYEGTLDGINELLATLQGYERFELRQSDPPIFRITVYSPDLNEAPVWELLANLKEKAITEHPQFANLSHENLKTLINFLKKPIAGADPAFTGGSTQVTLGMRLYELNLRGHTKFFTEDTVLRYSVTATNATQLNLAYTNVDQLFSPTQMTTPDVVGVTLPDGILRSMSNIPATPIPSGTTLLWSWLKRRPTTRQTQIGKVVITAEWWLDAWDTDIYDIYGVPPGP